MNNQIKSTLKIGILIPDFDLLKNYECKIIKHIISDLELELVLLIKDGRKEIGSMKTKLSRALFTKQIFANIGFKIQKIIESRLFPNRNSENKSEIIEQLNKIKCIELYPQRKGFLDIFSDEESDIVKSHKLDVILRHEFNIIRGQILDSAKHGIWSFHYGDNAINRGGPAGFWEIVLNQPYVGVTLQKLTSILDGGLIIDKAYYNWNFSHSVTNNDILESSVSILIKNLNRLKNEQIDYHNSLVYYNPLYKKPNLKFLFIYLFNFYSTLFDGVLYRIITTLTNKRKYCWSLYFSKGVFLGVSTF